MQPLEGPAEGEAVSDPRYDMGPAPLSPAESDAACRLILDHSPDCIKLLDNHARVAWINAAGCRLLELDEPAKLLGSAWVPLWPESAQPDVAAAVEGARRGQTRRFTRPCQTFGGTLKWWDVMVTAVPAEQGPPMLLSMSRDVTDLVALIEQERTLATEARAAREIADLARSQKDELLATVSHDLRIPLNTVLNWAVMLQVESGDPAAIAAAKRIERATTDQMFLIEQLLEHDRLDRDMSPAAFESIDVQQVVHGAIAAVRPHAVERRLEIVVTGELAGHRVSADPRRLRQVVVNLLANAVKFTPAGGRITVSLDREPAKCRITVRDTGVGISAAFLPRVFDRYSREDRPEVQSEHGLGLGLHIAKRLVELHGGTIGVDSAGAHAGASFTVVLPTSATRACGAASTLHPCPTRPDLSDPSAGRSSAS